MPERIDARAIHFANRSVREVDCAGDAADGVRNLHGLESFDQPVIGIGVVVKAY